MTLAAMLFMGISVSAVVALTAWCYYRVLFVSRRGAGRDEN
ncbi:MAG: hypothetical protein OEY08_14185 [Gammaproteobacteria bacterium]|nr:hypothetical protein [Gammaproteobacteria bacterium]